MTKPENKSLRPICTDVFRKKEQPEGTNPEFCFFIYDQGSIIKYSYHSTFSTINPITYNLTGKREISAKEALPLMVEIEDALQKDDTIYKINRRDVWFFKQSVDPILSHAFHFSTHPEYISGKTYKELPRKKAAFKNNPTGKQP